MKIRSYKILFRFFSYMSDRTNGTSFFVEYKLLLGILLIGLTGVSCRPNKQKEAKAIPTDSGLTQTTRRYARDSVKKDSSRTGVTNPPDIRFVTPDDSDEYLITCYEISIKDTLQLLPPDESQN